MSKNHVMKLVHVVGARPNFMKVAPVMAALNNYGMFEQILVHTGQHYDRNMSEVFFNQLGIPAPNVNLEVGSGSHAVQTSQIMVRFEEFALSNRPDLVLVYGDVNSTMAASIVCAKLGIMVGHVEAGLRSFDRSMPEEINRLLTDQVADLLFPPSEDGVTNLVNEGVRSQKIHMVGNVMIDTLVRMLPHSDDAWNLPELARWKREKYVLVTLHRPSNVDRLDVLEKIVMALRDISDSTPVLFPVHPRTLQKLDAIADIRSIKNLHLTEPLGYIEFLALERQALLVITDSGGVQEETTYLGVPCLTMRENTERPVTVTIGTNILVGHDFDLLRSEAKKTLDGGGKPGGIPPLWDGRAGERIAMFLAQNIHRPATEQQVSI